MKPKIPILFACTLGALIAVGFAAGKTAFTKKYQTVLLKDPQPLADTVATLAFATSVKITALQGNWADVSAGTNKGWIYFGNLSEEKPEEDNSIKFLRTSASATTASVAARPLSETAKQYAAQENLDQAKTDVEWMEKESDAITDAKVVEYMKANKKGEYQ